MKIVGLSGGIGSGKSTVAKVLCNCGIPVYNADSQAKHLMATNQLVIAQITKALGKSAYTNGILNRTYIANEIFNNNSKRELINSIVHPAVNKDFCTWAKQQSAPYVIQENALMFLTDSYKQFDYTIYVLCNQEERIKRTMQRNGLTKEQIIGRINAQAKDSEASQKANFVILNDGTKLIIPQILDIHKKIINS